MYSKVIMPVDGSDFSWRALGPASALADQCEADLEILQVVTLHDDVGPAKDLLTETLAARSANAPAASLASASITVVAMGETVAGTVAGYVESFPGSITVMSSVGRGRSAAMIGSIAEEILGSLFGPIMVVGPDSRIDQTDFRGDLIVPVDGSETSETALGLAAALGIALSARVWVVSVVDAPDSGDPDVSESSYTANLANKLAEQSHHEVTYEVLHGSHPDKAIVEQAKAMNASVIVASTHGRTGLARIRAGSVAMRIVRHAPCPVILNRPPHLR
jgi:nucleotide-binding universal stress UspA family protein